MIENSKNVNSCLTSKEIEKLLQTAGIQPTAQRIAICRYILCESKHTTVEEIKAWADLNFPKISLATIYNTVNILVEFGMVRSLKLPHSEKVIYDNNTSDHYHFIDKNTGELFDIDATKISINHDLSQDFEISNLDLVFYGNKVK